MTERRVLLRLILFGVVLVGRGVCKADYLIGYKDGFEGCYKFENERFDAEHMQLAENEETANGEIAKYLQGFVELFNPVKDGSMIEIRVLKEIDGGRESLFSYDLNFCEAITNKDAPWSDALEMMNITGCPVETGKYYCDNFYLDLEYTKKYINEEYEGIYNLVIRLQDMQRNAFSCHELRMKIYDSDDY